MPVGIAIAAKTSAAVGLWYCQAKSCQRLTSQFCTLQLPRRSLRPAVQWSILSSRGQIKIGGSPCAISKVSVLRSPLGYQISGAQDSREGTADAVIFGPKAMASSSEQPLELDDAEAFKQIASPEGLVSVAGFGSLLSDRSARFTFPKLQNFRTGRIRNFRRVFAHLAPIFFERGIAKSSTREMSSLSVEPFDGESIVVSVFEIEFGEVPAFIEREQEFRFVAITPEALDGAPMSCRAVVCSRFSDEEYRQIRLQGNDEEYYQRYGRWGIDAIWVDDVLPCRPYLRHCVLAARRLGPEAHESFLDHTFLSDRHTTIRQHLAANPDIMEELPPADLAERYGG